MIEEMKIMKEWVASIWYRHRNKPRDIEMCVEVWENGYDPLMDEDNCQERRFHWEGEQWAEFESILADLEPDKKKRYYHTWTLMTDDNGEMIICNGLRYVNRMEYIITREKWQENESIVVDYMGD
ncbi:MAG: hypothetical protein DRN17_04530 [Thermoplasmata archaeon]|nr:MAG: hypothetical protein DRN17_04530 [Thermoplasmata archaeon]